MILIITSKRDGHVEAVSKHLTAVGACWARLNTEDFATNVEVELEPASGQGRLWVKDSGMEVQLKNVGAVWYRKPDPVDVRHFDMDPGAREYVEAEFGEILLGLYALLRDAYWINDPFRTRIAHRKLLQLKIAVEVGFKIPRTLVTNRPHAVRNFADQLDGDLAIKSLGAISVVEAHDSGAQQYGIFTRRVTAAELDQVGDKIGHMPTLFQEFIPKESELRITCVGGEVFACRIQTRSTDITGEDYRFGTTSLEHTAVDRPDLIGRMHAYMKAFDLAFACFDFLNTKEGESLFCESNPNGQWAWVEERTGQPIGKAIARELLMHDCSGRAITSAPSHGRKVARVLRDSRRRP